MENRRVVARPKRFTTSHGVIAAVRDNKLNKWRQVCFAALHDGLFDELQRAHGGGIALIL